MQAIEVTGTMNMYKATRVHVNVFAYNTFYVREHRSVCTERRRCGRRRRDRRSFTRLGAHTERMPIGPWSSWTQLGGRCQREWVPKRGACQR